jgi:hypothetical protein
MLVSSVIKYERQIEHVFHADAGIYVHKLHEQGVRSIKQSSSL